MDTIVLLNWNWNQTRHKLEQLIAPHRRPHECGFPVLIHAVDRKDVLGKIDPHCNNRGHGLPLRKERTYNLLPGSRFVLSGRPTVAGVARGEVPSIR